MHEIAARIIASPKYRDIHPSTVERAVLEQLRRLHPSALSGGKLSPSAESAIEKAARNQLHMIAGAFMTTAQLKQARKCLDSGELERALSLHSSTRERLPSLNEVMAFLDEYALACTPSTAGLPDIADLACGLNPLYLGARGYSVRGVDIQGGCASLINDWAARAGWNVRADCGDLLCEYELPHARLTLAMKLLPVLEAQRRGAGVRLLERIVSERVCVSFPTRTLGGKQVGMRDHYLQWLDGNLPAQFEIIAQCEVEGELLCMLRQAH